MTRLSDVIAAEVRASRARQRITQLQLAQRLQWSVSTVGELETGKRGVSVNDLPLLCRALDVPLMELLSRAEAADLEALQLPRS